MKKIGILLGITLLVIQSAMSQGRLRDAERNFFNINLFRRQSTVVNVNLTGRNNGVDSNTLNRVIRETSAAGGGVIRINRVSSNLPNVYLRSIQLRNNIHIQINSNVTIRPWTGGTPANASIAIFEVGRRTLVRNVAITNRNFNSTNSSTWYRCVIRRSANRRFRMINALRVENFLFSGGRITEDTTILCNLEFNLFDPTGITRGNNFPNNRLPVNGVVKNFVSTGNDVGYGITQIRAGRNILFRNLDGEGGATLRIESGFPGNIESASSTIDRIVGRDITIRRGDAAVFLSPHRNNQGRVDVSGISAFNSQSAAFIGPGFLDGNAANAVNPNRRSVINEGSFSSNSFIGGFNQVIGGSGSQIKDRDISLYPCGQQRAIRRRRLNPEGTSRPGPSLAITRDRASRGRGCRGAGCYSLNLALNARVTRGLVGVSNTVGIRNVNNNCAGAKEIVDLENSITKINIYPNPTTNVLNVSCSEGSLIQIQDITSGIVKSIENSLTENRIIVSDLSSGLYFVSVLSNGIEEIEKVIIE